VISLKEANVLEAEVEDWICQNLSALGLGDLRVVERQHCQESGGRLDLLLEDTDNDRRFEVELTRGTLDPSHLIRAIEYWDIERRRYPAYEHCAVIVAEDIAARFLNVIQLFSGSVPIVALQLSCLKVAEKLTLNLIRVLDSRQLRDDEESLLETRTDRADWEKKVGAEILWVVDESVKIINAVSKTPTNLRYNQEFIGLTQDGQANHFVFFSPKKAFVWIEARLNSPDDWQPKLAELGLAGKAKASRVRFKVRPDEFKQYRGLIEEILQQSAKDDGT
jgi:hypothetical protein